MNTAAASWAASPLKNQRSEIFVICHSEGAEGDRGNPFSLRLKEPRGTMGATKITDCHTSVRTGSQ